MSPTRGQFDFRNESSKTLVFSPLDITRNMTLKKPANDASMFDVEIPKSKSTSRP